MMFVWMGFCISPQARFGSGPAFRTLLSFSVCYTLYHIPTDMICTTSGGVSRRRHGLIESCSRPHSLHRLL